MTEIAVVENLGELLRSARRAKGMSQEAVAYRAGVEQTDVSKFERGVERPSVERARRLATALDLEEDHFLSKRPENRR